MKRHTISVEDIASWHAVAVAAHRAAKGKRNRPEVMRFFTQPEKSIETVVHALRRGELPIGAFHQFTIHDPKRREIAAAPFVDRVAHHAIVAPILWPLESWLAHTSFACRQGKGVHAAALYAKRQCCRFPVYLKMDVKGYFDSVNHQHLLALLRRRLKGEHLFRLIMAVLASYASRRGYGLPIGALTSQQFANVYLNPADQWLQHHPAVKAHCRYMDDVIIWCDNASQAREVYRDCAEYLNQNWLLSLKFPVIQQSRFGLSFCGYRIFPDTVKPGKRRLRRCKQHVQHWQQAYNNGYIDIHQLQQNTDSAMAILQPGQSLQWRKRLVTRLTQNAEELCV